MSERTLAVQQYTDKAYKQAIALTTLNTAVFTPMPRANVSTTALVKMGDFRRSRVANTMSCQAVSRLFMLRVAPQSGAGAPGSANRRTTSVGGEGRSVNDLEA